MPDEAVPRVVVQSHLDGDPRPRAEEIREWNEVRRVAEVDEMQALILLPDESRTEPPFEGYAMHGYVIFERDGETVCEPRAIDLTITDDAGRTTGTRTVAAGP